MSKSQSLFENLELPELSESLACQPIAYYSEVTLFVLKKLDLLDVIAVNCPSGVENPTQIAASLWKQGSANLKNFAALVECQDYLDDISDEALMEATERMLTMLRDCCEVSFKLMSAHTEEFVANPDPHKSTVWSWDLARDIVGLLAVTTRIMDIRNGLPGKIEQDIAEEAAVA
jgi:hypothetical protein